MFVFGVPYTLEVTTAPGIQPISWGAGSVMYDATPGGQPVDDGEAVGRWVATDLTTELAQATVARRPVADLDLFPGRNGITVASDQYMAVGLPVTPRYILVIVGKLTGVSRTLLTRDTAASTTKPKYELVIEEYFS